MSNLVSYARTLLAVLQPATGTRATGRVNLQLADQGAPGGLVLARGEYLCPVIDGQIRPQMLFKLDANPDTDDGSWPVGAGGAIVTVISNIGGDRYNLPSETQFTFEPPLRDLVSAYAVADFVDGADHVGLDSIEDAVQFETVQGPVLSADLARSGLKEFPAVVVAFESIEPADGAATSSTERSTRTGTGKLLFRFNYTLSIITSRMDKGQVRRDEGAAIVGRVLELLVDRAAVDGECLSNPGGVQVRGVSRQTGPQDVYQKFYVYHVQIALTGGIEREDTRTYAPWLRACLTGIKEERAGDEDFIVVEDNVCVEMGELVLTTDPDGDVLVTENGYVLTQDGDPVVTQGGENVVVNP